MSECAGPDCTHEDHPPTAPRPAASRSIQGLTQQLTELLDNPEDVQRLRDMKVAAASRELVYVRAMLAKGGQPYHGVNAPATARRRARNKVARASRQAAR